MIYDKIQYLSAYRTLLPGIAAAVQFLAQTDLTTLTPGRLPLENGVIVNINNYTPTETGKWEAHRRYADLQYVVSGKENMAVARLCDAAEADAYDSDADLQFFPKVTHAVTLPFSAGDFAIFLPNDIHMPGLRHPETDGNVIKLVFKLPVAED